MKIEKIREVSGHSNEEPLKEISVLQYLAQMGGHPNVITCTEVSISFPWFSISPRKVVESYLFVVRNYTVTRFC